MSDTASNVGNNVKDRSGKTKCSMHLVLLDSGVNNKFYSNPFLLQNSTSTLDLLKQIKTASCNNILCNSVDELCDELWDLALLSGTYNFSECNSDNLLSLLELTKYFQVGLNSSVNNAFYVYEKWNNHLHFLLCEKTGLYLINPKVGESPVTINGYNVVRVED